MTGELRKAFVSDFTFAIGEHSYEGVFTAEYLDQAAGTFRIQIDPLGYTADGDPISVIITNDDIRGVRDLLGMPDFTSYYEACALAYKALNEIEAMKDPMPYNDEDWRELTLNIKALVRDTLAKIAYLEGFYATAADGA